MKIVYATDTYWPRFNGVTVSVDTFRRELKAQGHEVILLAPDYPGAAEQDGDERGRSIYRFESYSLFFDKEDHLVTRKSLQKVEELLDQLKPDIVHSQTEFTLGIACLKFARKRSIPTVLTSHTFFQEYMHHYLPWLPFGKLVAKVLQHKNFSLPDHIVVPSPQMGKVLKSYGIKVPISVVPTGIPEKEFSLAESHKEEVQDWLKTHHPDLMGRPLMLFVGRVGKEKNVDFLIPLMEKVLVLHPDAVMMLAGDGPFRPRMEALLAKEDLSDAFRFLGYVPRTELKYLYRAARIFTFPSKTETQGLVTIEAMICGTPVVAIGEMGTAEVMGGDNGGFMVRDNLGEFTSRVLELLGSEELWNKKSQEAREHARAWTMEQTVGRMITLYQEMLAE